MMERSPGRSHARATRYSAKVFIGVAIAAPRLKATRRGSDEMFDLPQPMELYVSSAVRFDMGMFEPQMLQESGQT